MNRIQDNLQVSGRQPLSYPLSLATTELSVAYEKGGKQVLEDISFSVPAGGRLGIAGANGAGKSTLMLTLAGCLKPEKGQLTVGNEVCEPWRERLQLRGRIGLVFQHPDDQLFMPRVKEDVAFGLRNQGVTDESVIDREVRTALNMVGAESLCTRAPHTLSGGEKRLVALAGILIMRPGIILLDEPTAGLDPRARRRLMRALAGLPSTQLIASHDLDFLWECCDDVLILNEGRVQALGKKERVLADRSLLETAGLELPLRLQACPRCNDLKPCP